jgi:cathepsin X
MHFSGTFGQYTGGIFSEVTIYPTLNHYVEVVGYGEENGKEYWSCRNFIGTAWGESGFFRIQMHSNNLGIETDCYWLGEPA